MSAIKRFILALLVAVSAFPIIATMSVSACSGDIAVVLYESNGGTGDNIVLCGSISELNNVVHTQAGDCAREQFDPEGNDWNNCADSIKLWLPAGDCFRTYNFGSYSSPLRTYAGPYFATLLDVSDDVISGIRFYPARPTYGCL